MSVTIACRSCAHRYVVADAAQRNTTPCPRCQFRLDEFVRSVLGGFNGEIEPPRITPFYRVGILLVAVFMLVLPMVYLALVLGVTYLVIAYAFSWGPAAMAREFRTSSSRRASAFIIMYLGPVFAGAVLVFFLVKPLFSKRPKGAPTSSLDPNSQKLLFEFVTRLCRKIGAPPPTEIRVNADINASAGFRPGLRGLVRRELVLTIGAPLAAGLTLRQFTGVLAHEFGHFSQSGAMRLTFLIDYVNLWFARVVYGRDGWDERLASWGKRMPLREALIIIYVAQGAVWLSRRLLWALMFVAHGLSSFLSREMEFDADGYQARIAGSEAFAPTFDRLLILSTAWNGVIADLNHTLVDGQLADNLCDLLIENVKQMPVEVVTKMRTANAERRTGLFDSHPCDKERVAAVAEEAEPGIFHVKGRATALFNDFTGLSRAATEAYYRDALGDEFRPERLVSVARILARQKSEAEATESRDRFFAGTFNGLRPLNLTSGAELGRVDARQAIAALVKLRDATERSAATYKPLFERYEAAVTREVLALQAAKLLQAGFKVTPADFQIGSASVGATATSAAAARTEQQQLAGQLERVEKIVERRLAIDLSLLADPRIAARLPEAPAWRDEAARLLVVARHLSAAWPYILQMRYSYICLQLLLMNIKKDPSAALVNTVKATTADLSGRLTEVCRRLEQVLYPFDHAVHGASIARYVLEEYPAADNLEAVFKAADRAIDQLGVLVSRLTSRLAHIGTAVEGVLLPAAKSASSGPTNPPSGRASA